MFNQISRSLRNHRKTLAASDPDGILSRLTGVIHVGANTGQERFAYKKFHLNVLWVEPIDEVFQELQANIDGLQGQRAVQALVTDESGKEYTFHVANNNGASSSILEFKEHADIWPEVQVERELKLTSTTLANLVQREGINLGKYSALFMDTQGSELLVLKGAESILEYFEFIKTEAPDFEAYAGCATTDQITAYLAEQGYEIYQQNEFAHKATGNGRYFDIIYRRVNHP